MSYTKEDYKDMANEILDLCVDDLRAAVDEYSVLEGLTSEEAHILLETCETMS